MDEGAPVSARLTCGAVPQRPALQEHHTQREGRCVEGVFLPFSLLNGEGSDFLLVYLWFVLFCLNILNVSHARQRAHKGASFLMNETL